MQDLVQSIKAKGEYKNASNFVEAGLLAIEQTNDPSHFTGKYTFELTNEYYLI